ncbi:MAG: 1-(5-phosphoribosyl)-5-[(5-phosphoribosylamino)methylideneamino]imidazole-4-carboxamide isomerase [Candidatus Omnitrophota bacterium]|nr:1-(5-phosphoribosyl)-5-[(5-phosphoribosylamino)methylideneamino]imidazole-4-carboxamide isomerase [Candidatus Omnitrophota bacterium]
MIKVIPAIDIKGGKVVRLKQGKFGDVTVYNDSAMEVARMWADMGAELIHVVDLDGALEGSLKNLAIVKEIARKVSAKLELGGGIRDIETIKEVLDYGVEKAVIGTRALEDDFLKDAAAKFGDRIVVGIDARDGIVYTKGWVLKTKIKAVDLVKKMADNGIRTINYTDISRDGMLKGPNIKSLKDILEVSRANVVASGGVSTMDDVRKLKELETYGLSGMIIGKALYEKTLDLKEAIKICSQKE